MLGRVFPAREDEKRTSMSSGVAFKIRKQPICAPGIDFVQLLGGMLEPIDTYDRMDELYDHYLATLHGQCKDAKVYTKKMLQEDFAMALVLWNFALAPVLNSVLEPDPDHALWPLMKPAFLRFQRCLKAVDAFGICKRLAIEEGIIMGKKKK